MKKIAGAPEFPLAVFGFAFHFIWEMLQVPLYLDMATMAHWDATLICAVASGGDIVIMLVAFYVAALAGNGRQWIRSFRLKAGTIFLATGVVITVIVENISTLYLDRWQYSDLMPVLPVINTGLSPFVQWIIVPLVTIWFSRYYLLGREGY